MTVTGRPLIRCYHALYVNNVHQCLQYVRLTKVALIVSPARRVLSQEDGVTTTRSLMGDKLIMTQTKGDVTATRTFYNMEKKD